LAGQIEPIVQKEIYLNAPGMSSGEYVVVKGKLALERGKPSHFVCRTGHLCELHSPLQMQTAIRRRKWLLLFTNSVWC